MKNGLLRFYFLFLLLSMGLFSCENRGTNHPRNMRDKEVKEDGTPKKSSRHYSRSSNLC